MFGDGGRAVACGLDWYGRAVDVAAGVGGDGAFGGCGPAFAAGEKNHGTRGTRGIEWARRGTEYADVWDGGFGEGGEDDGIQTQEAVSEN